jgi:hypothetical protein
MINEVRNAVLSILNKNNYGYISPSDFNLYAKNAQMEIYEEYFSSYNKVINSENARMSGTDYADIENPIAEVLELFMTTNYLSKLAGNKFYTPSLTTTGDEAYMILKVLCYTKELTASTNTSVSANSLVDATGFFTTFGITENDIVVNITTGLVSSVVSVVSNTTIALSSNIFLAAGNSYAIFSKSTVVEADKVSSGKITMLNNSNLTAPTTMFPSYVLQGNLAEIYPTSINKKGQIQANYFRYPKVPKWTYINLIDGSPAFDQSQPDYQDFELPQEDEYKLVTKILEYCGMSIRETEVTQFGMTQQAHEQPTFSVQQ